MAKPLFYLSLQYSAIQKPVLYHNPLWSFVGMSQTLAKLNEIKIQCFKKPLSRLRLCAQPHLELCSECGEYPALRSD